MKLFEKVKNIFTEEVEEDEVKVEKVQTKVKKDNIPNVVDSFDDVKIEKEEIKKPVFFTDHDFDDLEKKQNSKIERDSSLKSDYGFRNDYNNQKEYGSKNEYGSRSDYRSSYNDTRTEQYSKNEAYRGNQTNVYNDPYKEKKEERVFKPTPIISPVYGILDKNYHKEDIVSKKEVSYTPVGGTTNIDTVRKKAYGTLEDELENTLFGSNSILFNNKENEKDENDDFFSEIETEARPDLLDKYETNDKTNEQDKKIRDLEEITMDIGKELNSLINKKENLKGKESIDNTNEEEDDLFNLIDTMYEGDE